MRGRARVMTVVLALTITAGCSATVAGTASRSGTATSAGQTAGPISGPTLSGSRGAAVGGTGSPAAVSRFGNGPVSGPKYKPDVVLIGTGPDAIRGVSPDGVVWTMDGSAPGVADLAVGKVMFASSIAVGRVLAITDQGPNRVVTIEPITFADLIDGALPDVDQHIDLTKLTPQAFPQGLASDSTKDSTFSAPGSSLSSRAITQDGVFRTAPSYPWDPPVAGNEASVGEWQANPIRSARELGLSINYNKADLKVFADVSLLTDNLDFTMGGDPNGDNFRAVLSGVTGLKLDLKAGMGPGADPSDQNRRLEAELPISFDIPVTGGIAPPGIPVYLRVGFTFSVITALGAKNATVTGAGEYGLDGDIGIRNGQVLTPTLSVKKSLLSSVDGISLTPSGLVVAIKFKIQLGVGIPMAMVGPYVYVTASSGILKGAQEAINPNCKLASLDLQAGAGFGFDVNPLVAAILSKYTKKKIDQSKQKVLMHIHKQQTAPDVAACRIG